MELVLIMLLVGLASAFSRAVKGKQAKRAADEVGYDGLSDRPSQERPMRPADVDLPGQTTMPIHWEGLDETPRTIPSPEPSLAVYYGEGPGTLRPSEIARADEDARWRERSEAVSVTIPGLDLDLNGDSLVKGVIFSEILNRKPVRRPPQ